VIIMEEKFTRIKYQSKDDWLKMRSQYLTGTDASAILGLNLHHTSIDVWEDKVHGKKKPFKTNNLVKYGSKAESSLRALFKLSYPEYKLKHTNELLVNNKHHFLAGSLDGELEEIATGKKGIWENKTAYISNSISKEKWENDKIPEQYYIQTLHYLLVTEYDFVVLQVELRYEIDGKRWFTRKIYRFEREEVKDDLDYLLQKEIEFWEYVRFKKRPALEIRDL